MTISNQWLNVPDTAPFVPPIELPIVEQQIKRYPDDTYRLRTNVLPEPYIGHPDAPVYLLNKHPSYSEDDNYWHARDDFSAAIRANLAHGELDYPFYPLDERFLKSGAAQWWLKMLRELTESVGLKAAAQSLFCVEYLGYHSVLYKRIPKSVSEEFLPTQLYAASLVKNAIKQRKIIVLMRAQSEWLRLVPELAGYDKFYKLKNNQRVYVSPGNLDEYDQIVSAISKD